MKYDIVALLSSILNDIGMSDSMDAELSNHSTLSLHMKDDIPAIHIGNEDEDGEETLWVWSIIMENSPPSLTYCSANLIPMMMTHNEDFFYAGQPCLYSIDGNIELRAQVKEKYLQSPDAFLSLLDNYLVVLQDYRSVVI